MKQAAPFFSAIGLVVATTMGAGVFALPYVFAHGGVATGLYYLVLVAALISIAHTAYYDMLVRLKERHRLLGLIHKYLGDGVYTFALLVILGGLLLALVAYLILSTIFLQVLFPAIPLWAAVFTFWVVASAPIFLELRRFIGLEFLGALLMVGIVFILHVAVSYFSDYTADIVFINSSQFLLPFGPIVFALAGWTAVEPIFDLHEKNFLSARFAKRAIMLGTAIVAFIYLIFVIAVLGSGGATTPDTLSGLTRWPAWMVGLLAFFGLVALLTSYIPVGVEIVGSLSEDVKVPKRMGIFLVLFVPPALVALGIQNLLGVIGLVGSVFLGLQYVCIGLLVKKVLQPRSWRSVALDLVMVVFALAALYEIFSFVVRYVA